MIDVLGDVVVYPLEDPDEYYDREQRRKHDRQPPDEESPEIVDKAIAHRATSDSRPSHFGNECRADRFAAKSSLPRRRSQAPHCLDTNLDTLPSRQ